MTTDTSPGHGFKLLAFDFDGTLANSLGHIEEALNWALVHHGLRAIDGRQAREPIGLPLEVCFEHWITAAGGEPTPALVTQLSASYRSKFEEILSQPNISEPLFPGVRSTLDALRHPEVHFAVVTGKDLRGLTNVINHHGLADLFERNLQTPDTNASKPAPDMVFEAARQAGVDMADVVVVGDTTFDMMMAENAGVTAIGVSYGYHDVTRLQLAGATLIIDSFDQLPQALAKLKPQ